MVFVGQRRLTVSTMFVCQSTCPVLKLAPCSSANAYIEEDRLLCLNAGAGGIRSKDIVMPLAIAYDDIEKVCMGFVNRSQG